MDAIQPLDLKKRIDVVRREFPFLPAFLGPWGTLKRCETEQRRGNEDPKLNAFIEDLRKYVEFGAAFVKEQGKDRDPQEAHFVLVFCLDAFTDTSYDEYESLLGPLVAFYGDGEDFLPREKTMLLYDIVLGCRRGSYPWRAKGFAKELYACLLENDAPYEVWQGLSAFYKVVLDWPHAVEVASKGADVFGKKGLMKEAALLYRDALVSATVLPDYEFPSEEEIGKAYGQFAETVLGYPKFASMRHDPIESSPEFQAAYDDVMEEATARFLKETDGRIAHTLWAYMAEGFAKRGIHWRNPQLMNPSMKFD